MVDVGIRYTALCGALKALTANKAGLRVAAEEPFQVILQKGPEGPTVSLSVAPHTTKVVAISGPDHGGTSEVEDHLSVDLSSDFRWDSVAFEDADDLAYHLFKHMLRRTESVAHLDPLDEG